ncbi:MAG: exodeoxyribonuclease III [Acidobacteria bacterium]|nr:exodeoxyribonuclease III [Acidobacteriota bacterium]
MPMRFYSWNVNGFRAVLKKGFMEWLEATDPDVLNLQEVRCEWEEVDLAVRRELESAYEVCWFPSTVKKGYAGSATLSRKELGFKHTKGLGFPDYDGEGRLIVSTRGKLAFIAGYFPNASQGLVRLPFKRQFARDLAGILKARHRKKEQIVLAGDMNVAPEEIDLARPKDNVQSPGFTPEEREDFKLYLGAGMVDILRERNPGVPGLYTWWSQRGGARAKNVGWRIDLFLVSATLREQVRGAAIHPEVMASDHCPISLDLAD